ncbi:hypothetical protein P7C71_g5975, partial [Lecanoromycetidae sp. Uapishka_2]
MHSLSASLFLVLCTVASLTDAQWHNTYRRGNHRPSGRPGIPGRHHPFPFPPSSKGSPFASSSGAPPIPSSGASATAPYPAGNGTAGAGTGTGVTTGGPTGTTTIWSTRFITIEETSSSLASALPSGGESPISTGAASELASAAPSSVGESVPGSAPSEVPGSIPSSSSASASGSPASPSGILGGAGESTCPAPITVTITQDTTVTVTAEASPSQAPIESGAAIQSPLLLSSAATSNAAAAVSSVSAALTSADVLPIAPAEAASSQIPVQQMSDGQVIEPTATGAPVEAASGAAGPASSPASSVPFYIAPISTSSTDMSSAAPSQEATSVAQVSSSTPVIADTDTATTSVAASVAPTASSGSTSTSSSSLTPNGIKAGIGGYRSITDQADWSMFADCIGWYTDYWPDTPDSGKVSGIPMLWGNGHLGDQGNDDDLLRLQAFQKLYPPGSSAFPAQIHGFYEPDWVPPDSSNIDIPTAAANWTSLLQPLQAKGAKLGSPSMAEQFNEMGTGYEAGWLETFGKDAGLIGADGIPTWDYTVVHTNKPSVDGVKEDIEYYLAKYKKPIWVSEFTCIDDTNWVTCSDPTQISDFITESVNFFQNNESVIAYGYNNGHGLNDTWYMFDSAGDITTPGQIYLDLIKTFV